MKPLPVLYLKAFVVRVLFLKHKWVDSGLPNTFVYIALSVFAYQTLNLNNPLRNHMGLEGKFLSQNGEAVWDSHHPSISAITVKLFFEAT